MLRSIIKISITISLLTSMIPLAVTFVKESIDSFEKSIEKKPELNDLKFTSEITLPEAVISPGDTVITVTRKGLLKDVTYIIPIEVEKRRVRCADGNCTASTNICAQHEKAVRSAKQTLAVADSSK